MNPKDQKRWFEHRHLVTFGDTNIVGNVYFANFFMWQGECREALLAECYPEFADDLKNGYGMITEYAHQDFIQEGNLFDQIIARMTTVALSRTRIEFEFEFMREKDGTLLSKGRQSVIWTNQQHRPSIMPDKLYDAVTNYFGIQNEQNG